VKRVDLRDQLAGLTTLERPRRTRDTTFFLSCYCTHCVAVGLLTPAQSCWPIEPDWKTIAAADRSMMVDLRASQQKTTTPKRSGPAERSFGAPFSLGHSARLKGAKQCSLAPWLHCAVSSVSFEWAKKSPALVANDTYKGSRLSVIMDGCETQTFSAEDRHTRLVRPMGAQ
jgi:hypothetical protein